MSQVVLLPLSLLCSHGLFQGTSSSPPTQARNLAAGHQVLLTRHLSISLLSLPYRDLPPPTPRLPTSKGPLLNWISVCLLGENFNSAV